MGVEDFAAGGAALAAFLGGIGRASLSFLAEASSTLELSDLPGEAGDGQAACQDHSCEGDPVHDLSLDGLPVAKAIEQG